MWRVTLRRCEKTAAAYVQTWSFVYVPDECDAPRSHHAPATSLPRTRHVATSVSCARQPTASPTHGEPTPPPTTGSEHLHYFGHHDTYTTATCQQRKTKAVCANRLVARRLARPRPLPFPPLAPPSSRWWPPASQKTGRSGVCRTHHISRSVYLGTRQLSG
jgi:hypothetical protein